MWFSVALLFAWMVLGAAPSVFWEDSGNLVASAWLLGVPHPPGEPGWIVPARLAMLLPVGDLAFRANLLSSICVALCAVPLYSLLRACFERVPSALVLFAAGVGLAGYGARLQGVRAEVYGLTALLLLAALAAAVSTSGRRATCGAAAGLGLAATVHPLLALSAVPGVAAARIARSPIQRADVGLGLALGLLPALLYGYLPVRAAQVPARSWGIPSEPGAFVDVLLARNFAQNFGGQEADLLANLAVVAAQYRYAGGIGLVVLAGVGLWAGGGRPAVRALGIAAPVWILGNASTQAFQNKVFAQNPDLLGYLLPAMLVLVPLAAVGLLEGPRKVSGSLQRFATIGAIVLAVALAGTQVLDGVAADRRHDDLPRRFTTAFAHGAPPGAILMTSGNSTAFTWTWLDAIERRRVDLVLVHRVLLGHRHDKLRLDARVGGDLEAVTGLPWRPDVQARPLPALHGAGRPFFLEAREDDRGAPPAHGLVRSPAPPAPSTTQAAAAALAEFSEPSGARDPTAQAVAARFAAIDAELDGP